MKKTDKILYIKDVFNKIYGDADCTLNFSNAFELLIATQLAAQCTDARVNIVTESLFKKYTSPRDFANADLKELELDIRSTGFYHNKAKNIIACAKMIISDFGEKVPDNMEDLLRLPGVGRKTANLVLGEVFSIPGIVVDTHATRLANRIGLTKSKNPHIIEKDLLKIVPKDYQTAFCHQLVFHGREVCSARNPKCDNCKINSVCDKKIK